MPVVVDEDDGGMERSTRGEEQHVIPQKGGNGDFYGFTFAFTSQYQTLRGRKKSGT